MSVGSIALITCLVLAGAFVIAAIVVPLLAFMRLQKHIERTRSSPLFTKPRMLPEIAARLNGDLEAMEALVSRAQAAVATIIDALYEMRIPQAMAALRVAGAAIRLLLLTLRHAA